MATLIQSNNPEHPIVNLDKVDGIGKSNEDKDIVFYINRGQNEFVVWSFDNKEKMKEVWEWLETDFFTSADD